MAFFIPITLIQYVRTHWIWTSIAGLIAIMATRELLGLSAWFPPCLWTYCTGHSCWGCGTTTALIQLLKGDFGAAFATQKLIFVLIPTLFIYVLRDFLRFRKSFNDSSRVGWMPVVICPRCQKLDKPLIEFVTASNLERKNIPASKKEIHIWRISIR